MLTNVGEILKQMLEPFKQALRTFTTNRITDNALRDVIWNVGLCFKRHQRWKIRLHNNLKLINNSYDKNKGNQHRDGVWIYEEELT